MEEKQPAAIISATTRNPELAGAVYPFPMFEDGDFDIPSAYMTDVKGEKLASFAGSRVSLKMDAEIAHTSRDTIDRINPQLLADAAQFLFDLITSRANA